MKNACFCPNNSSKQAEKPLKYSHWITLNFSLFALFWKNNYDESIVEMLCINFLSKQKSVNKRCQLCLWCINLSSAFFFSAILRAVCWCKVGENLTCLTATGTLLDFYLEWTQPWIKIMHMAAMMWDVCVRNERQWNMIQVVHFQE